MPYKKLLNEAAALLLKKGENIAVAESVTAGLIQAAFSQADHATDIFEGGITAYNLDQKCTHLFIDERHALECNCVSETVAEQMALGVSRSFKSDWGLSITGYASPVPELEIRELFAWTAVSYKDNIVYSRKITSREMHSETVQEFYRETIIIELAKYLLKRWKEDQEVGV